VGGGGVDNSFYKIFNGVMAKVFAPFFSFRAKGMFADTIQVQPKPYTKGPASLVEPQPITYELIGEEGKPSLVFDFIFPLSGIISEVCEMERVMKVARPLGNQLPEDFTPRDDFADWAKAQQLAFKVAKALFDKLTEEQKTSWKIFGHMFIKQDICTLAVVPASYFDMFMSVNMFLQLANWTTKLFAPVMTEKLSAEAGARGWKATNWYYEMKKASLRRAWVLYRHEAYTIQQVMSVTEVWEKYKQWYAIREAIEVAANNVWHLW
jgi:hypothetical protein